MNFICEKTALNTFQFVFHTHHLCTTNLPAASSLCERLHRKSLQSQPVGALVTLQPTYYPEPESRSHTAGRSADVDTQLWRMSTNKRSPNKTFSVIFIETT
uniref:(northern house mosquito) hypothetical protein n=1 Tax=Culex pipiens TaxID=7175 RepID=A0A8D8G1L0_CULPI